MLWIVLALDRREGERGERERGGGREGKKCVVAADSLKIAVSSALFNFVQRSDRSNCST